MPFLLGIGAPVHENPLAAKQNAFRKLFRSNDLSDELSSNLGVSTNWRNVRGDLAGCTRSIEPCRFNAVSRAFRRKWSTGSPARAANHPLGSLSGPALLFGASHDSTRRRNELASRSSSHCSHHWWGSIAKSHLCNVWRVSESRGGRSREMAHSSQLADTLHEKCVTLPCDCNASATRQAADGT